ncbi:MAG: hypothetical protein KatS3mg124_0333 [Porticoccaceae bacterium]|nr:MAG: hypothetical protein KatS3mg124_0333 [Porticoccaceae bacterium]
MPIAAIPSYLGKDFSEASPGLRFGMYLPVWTTRDDQVKEVLNRAQKGSPEAKELQKRIETTSMDDVIAELCKRDKNPLPRIWEKTKTWSLESWKKIVSLTKNDERLCKALISRQIALAAPAVGAGSALMLQAVATAPFTSGLGNEHPLENGFAFLNPYGLPYLPGSGVKGVLRQAARELANGLFGDNHGWDAARRRVLSLNGAKIEISDIDVLFGRDPDKGESEHLRGALRFWDVIPELAGNRLQVEVMTPHQRDYYLPKSGNPRPPHDAGQPTPIFFLTIPPGSKFIFHVTCDVYHLKRWAPDLAEYKWKELLHSAFEHAFQWLGFGAKTSVGYGVMKIDDSATKELIRKAKEHEDEKKLAQLSPEEQSIELQRKELDAFRIKFEEARRQSYQPGGTFDTIRDQFINACMNWKDKQMRLLAADLLDETCKWGMSKKKERQKKLKEKIAKLREDLNHGHLQCNGKD